MRKESTHGRSVHLCALVLAVVVAGWSSRATGAVQYETLPGGNTYVVVSDPSLNWAQSEALVSGYGGHLVTINSAAEQAFVEQLLAKEPAPGGAYWIGLEKTNGSYGWITGEPVTYTNWLTGQPDNNQGIENIGSILWSNPGENSAGAPGTWNDLPAVYFSAQSTYVDLNNGGYIAEYTGTRTIGSNGAPTDDPVAVPVPPALLAAPVGLVMAGLWMRRKKVA